LKKEGKKGKRGKQTMAFEVFHSHPGQERKEKGGKKRVFGQDRTVQHPKRREKHHDQDDAQKKKGKKGGEKKACKPSKVVA